MHLWVKFKGREMSLESEIEALSNYAVARREWLATEEAVKTAVILKLFDILGYDIHDPLEIVPEFNADVGTKRGEKVDYALCLDGKVQIIVECKAPSVDLARVQLSQLFRYYATTEARFAILTNGYDWQFYTDTEASNKMDLRPFLRLNLQSLTPQAVRGLARFQKSSFDPDSVARAAASARLDRAIMAAITDELSEPSEEYVRMIASRLHDGRLSRRIFEDYEVRVRKAMRQTLQEIARMRADMILKSEAETSSASGTSLEQSEIVTTPEEIEGFEIAMEIASREVDRSRIVMRDQKTYCNVLLDNNNRKPLMRMWFNNPERLYVEFFDGVSPSKIPINSPCEVRHYASRLRVTARQYIRVAA